MIWVGLTGGIGSGKSTVLSFLKKKGYPVLSADELAHEALRSPEILEKIRTWKESPHLDLGTPEARKDFGRWIFESPERVSKLEDMVHPYVKRRALAQKELWKEEKICFYEVPLLFEKNLKAQFDQVVVVTSSLENTQARVSQRGWNLEELQKRLENQMPVSEKELLADHVIPNDGSIEALEACVEQLILELLR